MAAALRSVGPDDRLSLVEHLTELPGRIVIPRGAFLPAPVLCMWQNQRVLDILNHPLTQTVSAGKRDPIQEGANYDQLVARWIRDEATIQRRTATAVEDPQLKALILQHAREGEALAKVAPKIQA